MHLLVGRRTHERVRIDVGSYLGPSFYRSFENDGRRVASGLRRQEANQRVPRRPIPNSFVRFLFQTSGRRLANSIQFRAAA